MSQRTTRRAGPDACPGVVRVHQAADGGLVRVRLPGGRLTGAQFDVVRRAAADLGNGQLTLTTRGNLQLRGLAAGAERELADRLDGVGMLPPATHETVRNIVASPLSGRDAAGLADVRPLVSALDAALCVDPVLAGLPGRFLFALDDGRGDVAALDADVAVRAVTPDELAVLLAGADSGLRVRVGDAVPVLVAAAHAFLAVRPADAWRLAEIPDGVGMVAATLRGSGLVRSGGVGLLLAHAEKSVEVGLVWQVDGRVAVGVVAPLGRLTATQAVALADAATQAVALADAATGPALAPAPELIVTPWRGVIVPDLPPDMARDSIATLAAAGLVVDGAAPWLRVTACTGRPGCANARADVAADALAAAPPAGDLPVHWIGCDRACGRPAGRHLAVLAIGQFAAGAGYELSLDGRVVAHTTDPDRVAAAIATARRAP